MEEELLKETAAAKKASSREPRAGSAVGRFSRGLEEIMTVSIGGNCLNWGSCVYIYIYAYIHTSTSKGVLNGHPFAEIRKGCSIDTP